MRVSVDGFEDKGKVVFLFGEPKEVVFEFIEFDFDIAFGKHEMPVLVEPQYLLLPSLDAEAPRVADVVEYPTIWRFRRLIIIV